MSRVIYIVATPLGNMGDITHRAKDVLSSADMILAEHPDHTRHLLRALDINVPKIKSYHKHNEKRLCEWLLAQEWSEIALVSDAGTPNIHDPGLYLLEMAYEMGYKIVPVPGPSALTAALSVVDKAEQAHMFVGFLPQTSAQKLRVIKQIEDLQMALVFYEAPHRICKTVDYLLTCLGDRQAWLCRELTKKYEQVVKSTLGGLKQALAEGAIPVKGEFVLVVAGAKKVKTDDYWQPVARDLSQHMSHKMVAEFVSQHFDCRKNEVYAFLLRAD